MLSDGGLEIDSDYGSTLYEKMSVPQIKAAVQDILRMADLISPIDYKLEALISTIQDKQKMLNNKVMVFSSFRHTLNYLHDNLSAKGFRVGIVHGGVKDFERVKLRERFCGSEGILTANGKRYFEAINIFSTENMDESILQTMHICGWNTLSLCPICATKYKYCQVNFSGIIEQIENKEITQETESVSLSIELQNKATTITFMPKHFLALQTAIKKIKEFES